MSDMAAGSPPIAGEDATAMAPPQKMGLVMATSLVTGNIIGSGVFLLPGALAFFGGIALFGWVITTIGSLALALVFATLGRSYPSAGGPYVYVNKAFGEFAGFQTAWSYWLSALSGNAATIVALLGYIGFFWRAVDENKLLAIVVGLGTYWALTLINIRGTQGGGVIAIVTTIGKLIPLLLIAFVGVFSINTDYFKPFNASDVGNVQAIIGAGALTLFAFVGIEAASVTGDRIANPQRNIPLSTMIGTVTAAVVYILGTAAVFGAVPRDQLLVSGSPFADAGKSIFGSWGGNLIAIGAIISVFGALNGWTLLQAEVPMAAAQDGVFPKQFARVNTAGIPVWGMIVSSLIATVILLLSFSDNLVEVFTQVLLISTLLTLIPYSMSAAAQLMLFITDRASFSAARLVKDVIIASVAFAYTIFMILGSGETVVFLGFVGLLLGTPVFLWIIRQRMTDTSGAVAPAAVD
jgi:APA family basic amino acid/polyamine antiporter